MGTIEDALGEKCFPALFGGEEINSNFRKILGHIVKHGSLGIPDPWFSVESVYNTSKADSDEMVESLLGGSAINYVDHKACIHRISAGAKKKRNHVELKELARQKELAGSQ